MKLQLFFAVLIVAIIIVSGCTASNNGAGAPEASLKCQNKCIQLASTKTDFSRGPCIDDSIMAGWVCDMAHSPREAVDDEPANQCPSFGKTAHHFVEVSESCRVIRVV